MAKGSEQIATTPGDVPNATTAPSPTPLRLLVIGNGHGEDAIGASLSAAIAERVTIPLALEAWPMVGSGDAYRRAGIAIRGPYNSLPSEGFATLGALAFARDVRAGWFGVHWRQLRAAIALRGACDFAIAIGDIVPLVAARASGARFVLVGCARSAYYGGTTGYTLLERRLMRQAEMSYPRDERTSVALRAAGVGARFLGNPMMDALGDGVDEPASARAHGEIVIACLPGSRSDQEENAATILALLGDGHARYDLAGITRFEFATAPTFDATRLSALLGRLPGTSAWTVVESAEGVCWRRGALRASIAQGGLRRVLSRARVAIGLAGTANEQAVGAGVPVVTFATDGVQGDNYLRMKMPYFGASAIRVERSADALADAVLRVVGNDALHARMAAAGRERMGAPGATAAIASDIVSALERLPAR